MYGLQVLCAWKLFLLSSMFKGSVGVYVLTWEVKPFLWFENGTAVGLYPTAFKRMQDYCGLTKNIIIARFPEGAKGFHAALTSQPDNLLTDAGNISAKNGDVTAWVPILVNPGTLDHLQLTTNVVVSESVVIVDGRRVDIITKILSGIRRCSGILAIALVSAVCFSVFVWLIERSDQGKFNGTFLQSIGTGIWFSLVTLATVGYGDITPRSLVGRVITVIWMFAGIILTSSLTATLTESVTGDSDFDLFDKKVSVLRGSREQDIVARDWKAIPVPCDTYEEALLSVKMGEVFASVIQSSVASYLQDDFKDKLSIVRKLAGSIPVMSLLPLKTTLNESWTEFLRCINLKRADIWDYAQLKYERPVWIENVRVYSLGQLFMDNQGFHILCGVTLCLVVLASIYEAIRQGVKVKYRSKQVTTDSIAFKEMATLDSLAEALHKISLEVGDLKERERCRTLKVAH